MSKDYYPFGMVMPGRKFTGGTGYRYGFNGKEEDDEVKGDGNQYDYGFRIYDPRIGRFLSTDPLTSTFPYYTPYQFSGNMPIAAIDLDGLEQYVVTHYKDNTSRIYKTTIRVVKSNNVLQDQNVKKIIPNSDIDNSGFKTTGDKIAKGNVLVFEIYNEGSKNEQMKISKSGLTINSLTKEEQQVYKSGNGTLEIELGKGIETDQLLYGTSEETLFASKSFINESTETYVYTKIYNKPPLRMHHNNGWQYSNANSDKQLVNALSNQISSMKKNPNEQLTITFYYLCDNGVNEDGRICSNGISPEALKKVDDKIANYYKEVLHKEGISPERIKFVRAYQKRSDFEIEQKSKNSDSKEAFVNFQITY